MWHFFRDVNRKKQKPSLCKWRYFTLLVRTVFCWDWLGKEFWLLRDVRLQQWLLWTGIMQKLKVLLCLQLHPNHCQYLLLRYPWLQQEEKPQTLEQLWCTNRGKEWSKEVTRLLASKAVCTEPPEEKILTVHNKDALRILGCNKLHSKGVLITLIPQEEFLPQWNWWLPAAEQDKAGSPAQNSISTCYCREWENNPTGEGVNAVKVGSHSFN